MPRARAGARGRIEDAAALAAYVHAGNATLTLQGTESGVHYTYKVDACDDGERHFVRVLDGKDHLFLGTIFERARYAHGRMSGVPRDAPAARAWAWFHRHLCDGVVPPSVAAYHEGRCGRCGRPLTHPGSITSGFGPECTRAMG